jgi:hypothetical protein
MKTAWIQTGGTTFLLERFDDGSYGVRLDDQFLGYVVRNDAEYIAIGGTPEAEGAVYGVATSLGSASRILLGASSATAVLPAAA